MGGLADNVAILSNFADRYVLAKWVRYIKVEAADQERLAYAFLTVAHAASFSDKMIIWSDVQVSEAERRTLVSFENGKWVFRDGFGKVCAVH